MHSNINDIIDFYRACVGSSIIIENKYSLIVFLYVFFIYFDMQCWETFIWTLTIVCGNCKIIKKGLWHVEPLVDHMGLKDMPILVFK
jgi:hypothetical protein